MELTKKSTHHKQSHPWSFVIWIKITFGSIFFCHLDKKNEKKSTHHKRSRPWSTGRFFCQLDKKIITCENKNKILNLDRKKNGKKLEKEHPP